MAIESPENLNELKLRKNSLPKPGKGEVQIRVHRAGVAFGDIIRGTNTVMKIKFPWTPGYDVAGFVTAVGKGVKDLKAGQRVTAFSFANGYSQMINISSEMVLPLPESVSFEMAVALNLNYVTAYQMMTRIAPVKEGDTILVHSAAGGVGSAVLDLARSRKIKAYGTASTGKQEFITSLGAEPIDYSKVDFVSVLNRLEPLGIDAAYEARGLENALLTRKVIGRKGSLVIFGYVEMFSREKSVNVREFAMKLLKLLIFNKGIRTRFYGINPMKKTKWYREDLENLIGLAAEGKINPKIHAVLPLESASEAQDLLLQSKVRGKVLLDCE